MAVNLASGRSSEFPIRTLLCHRKQCAMRALSVFPGVPNSMWLDEVAEPPRSDGDVLVETLAIGICGTDREIAAGAYGQPPRGSDRLIIGHESLGRVLETSSCHPSSDGELHTGDLVVGIVRRPDPV